MLRDAGFTYGGAPGVTMMDRTAVAREVAITGVEALTPAERRVADLAAEGRTNRQIAESLFVTPKAVEFHLANAFPKLGIASRREIRGALRTERSA